MLIEVEGIEMRLVHERVELLFELEVFKWNEIFKITASMEFHSAGTFLI